MTVQLVLLILALGSEPVVASPPRTLPQAVAAGDAVVTVTGSGTLTAPLLLKPGQTLKCDIGVEIECSWGVDGNCIELADGCTLDGCTLVGKWTGPADHPVKYREGMHGVAAYGAKAVTIRNVVAKGFHGDGCYLGPRTLTDRSPAEFTVTASTFEANFRTGLAVTSGIGVIDSCKFLSTSGAPTQAGLDLEPGDGGDSISVTVRNCDSRGNKHAAYLIALSKCKPTGKVPQIAFENCTGESPPPWQIYRMADCWKSRKDADGKWLGTNDGHPAEQLPAGATIVIDSVEILRKR